MDTPSVRVLVVGDSGVGKTTLLRALCRAQSLLPSAVLDKPPTLWTTGCDVHVLLTTVEPDGRDVFVEFLDVGGHRQYERSRRAFYYDVQGVIFVHDLSNTKSGDHLCQWSRELSMVQRVYGCVVPSRTNKTQAFRTLRELPKLVIGSKRDLVATKNDGGRRAKGPRAFADFGTVSCIESSAEPLCMEPSGAFATFLRQTLAFAKQKDGVEPSYTSYEQSYTGLRQLASRTADAEERTSKGGSAGPSSTKEGPSPISGGARATWW